jgi:uncharacterized protein YndB with AHSA1/START domain
MTTTIPTDPHGTTIEADPNLPVITIVRDFAAPAERVYQAWTDPALVVQWMGPDGTEMKIDHWEAVTGGRYRYTVWQGGQEVAGFYGSFHEARPGERLGQTFTWEGMPDGVSLDAMTFTDLGNGRSRVTSVSVVDSLEGRNAILSSGMEVGVYEGYAKLDALLAKD